MHALTQRPPIGLVDAGPRTNPPRAGVLFLVDGLTSFATTLLVVAIFFFTKARFGWGLRENFQLAALQGVVYVAGSLLAGKLASRLHPIRALVAIYLAACLVGVAGAVATRLAWPPAATVVILMLYSFVTSLSWPILEGLVSTGVGAAELSRRIGLYNVIWSGTGALAVAANGTLIKYRPDAVFAVPALLHLSCAAALWWRARKSPRAPFAADATVPHAERELMRVRTLALWLSRIALPSTYVVIYAISAMLPSLPVVRSLDVSRATLVGSAWLFGRWLTFLLLGLMIWWHTRPRALLASACVMLVAFVGMILRPSDWTGTSSLAIDLAWMIAWQVALGATIGLIYCASLYFGMVLSHGSTEHGGYHEALIGMGQVVGPVAGAIAEILRPGSLTLSVSFVGAIIAASIVAASVAALRADRQTQ